MPNYRVRGHGKDTNRARQGVYHAPDEAEARMMAEADGTIVEEVREVPPEPATEAQLSYARDLGIPIPDDATKEELQLLLSSRLEHLKLATDRHKSFAERYGVAYPRIVVKSDLFEMIFAALRVPGRERDLASWFAYRVYRELVHGADDAPVAGPDDPLIQDVAAELTSDESVINSVRRYSGQELIWFGEFTDVYGTMHKGGSNRTVAYKRAIRLLREKMDLTSMTPKTWIEPSPINTGGGDFPFLAFAIMLGLIVLVVLLIMHLR